MSAYGFVVTKHAPSPSADDPSATTRVFACRAPGIGRGWGTNPWTAYEFPTAEKAADYIRRYHIEGAEVRPLLDF